MEYATNNIWYNEAWHYDGDDKLKPYGLSIHRCVNGYLRRVIWLCLCKSNNKPLALAILVLNTLRQTDKSRFLRTNFGAEDGIMAGIQCFTSGDLNGHRYGTSPSNQGIKNWWSQFKRGYPIWVVNQFKEMVNTGELFLGSHTHM